MCVCVSRAWQLVIEDLDKLLLIDSCHADAYLYRAQACAELRLWDQSLADLSAAIRLNPVNAKAFYYRGCLLHTCVIAKFLFVCEQDNSKTYESIFMNVESM